MIKLIEEFNNMDKLPMFEIEHNGEYYIYNIEINEDELTTECGMSVELEEEQTLDYHLEGLYKLCLEDAESQDTREDIGVDELETMYDEMLNECYPEVFNIQPARILEQCDPIAYNCGLSDYYDSIREEYYCEDME